MDMLTIKEVWSNGYWNSGRMKWVLTLTESGQRNIRSITEWKSLVLSA